MTYVYSSGALPDPALYATAFDHSVNAIALCEAVRAPTPDGEPGPIVDFRYLLINRRYEALENRQAGEVIGQLATTLFPEAATQAIWQRAADVVHTGHAHRQQLRYTTLAGYTGWFDLTISRWENRGVVISLLDVSEQQARLLTERREPGLLRQVIKNSLNGILMIESIRNEQGQLVDFRFCPQQQPSTIRDESTIRRLRQSSLLTLLPALRQMPFPKTSPDRQQQTIFDRYVEVVETGESIMYDVNYPYDGYPGWYWLTVSKLNDGLIVTFLDISDVKNTQQQLESTVRELEQTNRNLEQFAYVASHDLQEPLRKITAFGDLLQQRLGPNTDESVHDVVRRMQRSAQRMQGLVKDLLTYSRLIAPPDHIKPLIMSQVVSQALSDLQPLIDQKQAIIETDTLEQTVPGDANQLRQLFVCLLANSLTFQQVGTVPRIRLTATTAEAASLPPSLLPSNRPFVAISVTDNGIGFEEKYLDRIFTIFQRLHRRGQYGGTGIGLTIARKVAENHGGTITAVSKPNKGATFTVWLPEGSLTNTLF